MSGKLYLLPNLLDESLPTAPYLPHDIIPTLQGLIAESEKAGRRYLRRFLSHDDMVKCPLRLLNEHTTNLSELLQPLLQGQTWGLISDAGLPCIADPGSDLVWLCHQNHIPIETFVGPTSLIMALQLSGLSGQQFAFHGYLPRESPHLENKIKHLEKQEGGSNLDRSALPLR